MERFLSPLGEKYKRRLIETKVDKHNTVYAKRLISSRACGDKAPISPSRISLMAEKPNRLFHINDIRSLMHPLQSISDPKNCSAVFSNSKMLACGNIPRPHPLEELIKLERIKAQCVPYHRVRLWPIREDYYSTLICCTSSWAPNPWEQPAAQASNGADYHIKNRIINWNSEQEILYGSNSTAFRYSRQTNAVFDNAVSLYTPSGQLITSMALSKTGYLVVCYSSGHIELHNRCDSSTKYSVTTLVRLLSTYSVSNPQQDVGTMDGKNYITCCCWLYKSKPKQDTISIFDTSIEFIAGDNRGRLFKIALKGRDLKIVNVGDKQGRHTDSVCSIAVNSSEAKIAVCGNDNNISFWNHRGNDPITNQSLSYKSLGNQSLSFKSTMTYPSAIRGMSYNPVYPNLLATGGGRHDRSFRLIDTDTNSVLTKLTTQAQVVGTIWLSPVDVLIGLGHSRVDKYSGIALIFNILSKKIVSDVPGKGYALNVIKSDEGFIVHTNDSIIHLFKWNPKINSTNGEMPSKPLIEFSQKSILQRLR